MDVVALVPSRNHVCVRYRIAQFERYLASAGLSLTLEPLASTFTERVKQLSRSRHGQITLLLRKLLPFWQLAMLRRATRTLIYDFDDAVYLRDSFHPRGPYSVTRMVRFAATVCLADKVFAGNRHLADEAIRHGARRKVSVVPTCVDARQYPVANHHDEMPTRLVWIGSASTMQTLERAKEVLEAIGESTPNAVLRVVCNKFPRFKNLRVEPMRWSSATEGTDLSTSDIGFSWIPDDAWSRGKCGLKVLQYMAAGLPVVASPVGVHEELLEDEGGYLPRRTSEWVETVGRLSVDAKLRHAKGGAGRRRLEKRFHVETWGPVIAEQLAAAGRA
jgi:glycosyltransferase involved in cell wall biosynthesis